MPSPLGVERVWRLTVGRRLPANMLDPVGLWFKMAAARREAELVVEMRAWRRAGAMVVGHWCFAGSAQDLCGCRSDWVPAKGAEFPEFRKVSSLGQYSTIQTTGAGYKELVHRQLYQDLISRRLPADVEVHHRDGTHAITVVETWWQYPPGSTGDCTEANEKECWECWVGKGSCTSDTHTHHHNLLLVIALVYVRANQSPWKVPFKPDPKSQ